MVVLKLKFVRYQVSLDITNNMQETMIFGQNLCLTTNHLRYCILRILAFGANDPVVGTTFAKAGCLQ